MDGPVAPLGMGRMLRLLAQLGGDLGSTSSCQCGILGINCPGHIAQSFKAFCQSFPSPSGHYCHEIKNYYLASQITSGCV